MCRLFHKVDEKSEDSKYDEVEPTGSSPSTSKSSPDEISLLEVCHRPAPVDTDVVNAPEDRKKWAANETDHRMTTTLVPAENCVSDGVNHSGEDMVMEVSREYSSTCFDISFLLCVLQVKGYILI